MAGIYDAESVRQLSRAQRHALMRELAAIEDETPFSPARSWRWDALLVGLTASCVILAAWIAWLGITLPAFHQSRSWRGAWVGFDIGLLIAFTATAWAAWRRRQLLIGALGVLATLLVCDAWFDVLLDVRTTEFWWSLASALVVELPLAVLAVLTARRLLRLTYARVMRYEGQVGPVPPLYKIPLLGPDTATPLRRLMRARANYVATGSAAPDPTAPPHD